MKRRVLIILSILLALALLVLVGVLLHKQHTTPTTEEPAIEEPVIEESDDQVLEMQSVEVPDIQEETHGVIKFQDLEFDNRMLGKWQHATNSTWFRVYTTEPADDGFYWGREWDTADDIFEEDLTPYGNGWFMWRKDGDYVIELHMTDNHGAAIPFEYKVTKINDREMNFKETKDTERHQFFKCD